MALSGTQAKAPRFDGRDTYAYLRACPDGAITDWQRPRAKYAGRNRKSREGWDWCPRRGVEPSHPKPEGGAGAGLTRVLCLGYILGVVKRRLLRMIVLLWIGWYVTGPLAETLDHWDGPHQEIHDILFNAGGGVTLIACAFSLVVLQARKLKESCALPRNSERALAADGTLGPVIAELRLSTTSIHSPPFPLRV